jgi:hypothetical protein
MGPAQDYLAGIGETLDFPVSARQKKGRKFHKSFKDPPI